MENVINLKMCHPPAD